MESVDDWFAREVLVHEDLLMRFLMRVWPRRDEIADIRQETYVRVYEHALTARPHSPKAFLFSTARHLMADRVRRERIVSIQAAGESDFLNVLVDELSPERRLESNQDLTRLARAFDRLPDRYRRVFWLRRVKQLSQKETADRLGLTGRTVEKYLRTGLQMLAERRGGGAVQRTSHASSLETDQLSDDEPDHGYGPPLKN